MISYYSKHNMQRYIIGLIIEIRNLSQRCKSLMSGTARALYKMQICLVFLKPGGWLMTGEPGKGLERPALKFPAQPQLPA